MSKAFSLALLMVAIVQATGPAGAQVNDDLHRGIALYQAKDYQGAAPLFLRAAQSNNNATTNYYLALCYQNLNYQAQATELFKRIIKQWPGSSEAKLSEAYLRGVEGQPAAASPAKAAENEETPWAKKISKAEWDALPAKTRVPYVKERGHLMVQARLNGKYAKLLFDTGAALCAISLKDHPDIVSTTELANGKRIFLARPNGTTVGRLCPVEISLQDVTRKVDVAFTTEPGVNVIGQNFFQEYSYQIDDFYIRMAKSPYQAEPAEPSKGAPIAAVSKQELKLPAKDKYTLPFERVGNVMMVDIEINGHRTKAVFDTGCAPDGIVIRPGQFDAYGLNRNSTGPYAERLIIGPVTRAYAPVHFAGALDFPLIGPKVFNRPYTVDPQAKCIRFDY